MTGGASGRPFWKMSGSGNDFIFLDARGSAESDELEQEDTIVALCRPHLGIGADGVVFIVDSDTACFAIRYYNADGSPAALCGNASLCAVQSAVMLGLVRREDKFDFMSDAGLIRASIDRDGGASVRLSPVEAIEIRSEEPTHGAELRIGFAIVGVPHLVVLVPDVAMVDVATRGRELRYGATRSPTGANVNFVSPGGDATESGAPWRIRTYERGVEAETYACGTGAVATAACLVRWGLASTTSADRTATGVALQTASGSVLRVALPGHGEAGWSQLSGEGRLVYEGSLRSYR